MSSSHEIEIGGDSEENGNNSIVKMDHQNGSIEKQVAGASNTSGGSSKGKSKGVLKIVKGNLLVILTILGVIVGSGIGMSLKSLETPLSPREIMYLKFPGELFLRMLKCLTLPLICSSMIAAVGSLDISLSRKIGGMAISYYSITVAISVIIGVFLALLLKPGGGISHKSAFEDKSPSHPVDGVLDLIRNMFPPNIVEATIKSYKTELSDPNPCNTTSGNATGDVNCVPTPIENLAVGGLTVDGTNILGMVTFSLAFGIALALLQEKGKPALNVFVSLSDSMFVITGWVIWTSPVGIGFLMAAQLLEEKDVNLLLKGVGKYFGTVVLGQAIHVFFILPSIYMIFTRTLPFRFFANMTPALITAFGTSSSAAALPQTIQCLEEANGVDRRITRFLIPIGSTINMDGAAIYEAVAVLFIAQIHGMDLSVGQIISVGITAAAASVGAAGIPQGGLVTMSMVLYSIGLPAEYVSYITPIDWLVDRFSTVTNVTGDAVGAGLIYSMSKNHLHELDILREEESVATDSMTALGNKKQAMVQEDGQTNSIHKEE